MAKTVRLTKEGHARLEESLEKERERLEEATRILRELTVSSDDYDDSGMEDAKREKARIEQRIDDLEDQLRRAEIIDTQSADHMDLGCVANLTDTSTNETFEVQLVSPVEAGVLEGNVPRISDESPLGRALAGRKAGETFTVTINNKTVEYRLESIS